MSDTGERTFDTVRERYQGWFGSGRSRRLPGRDVSYGDENWDADTSGENMSKVVLLGIGVVIGLVLLGLAALSFATAAKWEGYARDGAFVGYSVVGFFLVVAGLGSIIATWNHFGRAAKRPAAHH